MLNQKISKRHFLLDQGDKLVRWGAAIAIASLLIFSIAPNASAHHAFGGKTPTNLFEAVVSGFAHPIIGLDHFAFVVASGIMAIGLAGGIFIPVAFILATMLGTGIHLMGVNLPFPEIIISASVLLFGLLLTIRSYENNIKSIYTFLPIALAAIAGIFHGYAYGEAIVGAEMTPLVGYLLGFAVIQLAIATGAYLGGSILCEKLNPKYFTRFVGSAIAAVGVVFLSSAVLG